MNAPENGSLSPLVLVVDDYPDTREVVAELLSISGFRVERATTGTEALEKVTGIRPDIILLDLSLPELDGFEVARRLRADPDTERIPIIAFTAHALQHEQDKALEAGCDAVITKPCELTTMVDQIRDVLGRSM